MFARLSPYWLWLLLALPALGMTVELATSTNPKIYHILVHPTGEFAARFMIIAMMATPLMMLFRGWRGPQWLRRNRRYFGVAAFAYAAVHTVFYIIDKAALDTVLAQATRFDMATGWLSFVIFLPLAATSMDWAVRKLGPAWKPLQRWTYAAAVLTLLHWASLHDWGHPAAALVHFAPLAALSLYRLWWTYLRPRPMRMA
ncbi:ferric reductase-like transmembrane domain-containing protein [Paracoccaceae bacterium Fryx2]|nr:ferric reductase-like transmembrane domain-containing protein [Paracoccaceae bacterium Fryx2]